MNDIVSHVYELASQAPSDGTITEERVVSPQKSRKPAKKGGKKTRVPVCFCWDDPGQKDEVWLGVLTGFSPFSDPTKVIDKFYNCTIKLKVSDCQV